MKTVLIVIIVAIIAIAGFSLFHTKVQVNVNAIETDRTVSGDYTVGAEEKIVVKNGATLTVNGTFDLKGTIACENNTLKIVAKGPAKIEGTMLCNRPDGGVPAGDTGAGISIVAEKGIVFGRNAVIVSNGHVQIVDKTEKLASTREAFDAIYDDAGRDSGTGPRIGPLVPGKGSA